MSKALLLLLVLGVEVVGFTVDDTVYVTVLGKEYVVEYDVDWDGATTIPLTNPVGPPHYQARARVWRVLDVSASVMWREIIGEPFWVQYVNGGCFDADPEQHAARAIGGICHDTNHHLEGSQGKFFPCGECRHSATANRRDGTPKCWFCGVELEGESDD